MNDLKNELLNKSNYSFEDLCAIIEILRSPGGCPWDQEQDHHSIRNDFIEETYEVIEAIDNDDSHLLQEELGDVMLQVLFHISLSKENGDFSKEDVFNGICTKLITRHPHVFGDVKVSNTKEVLKNWEQIKNKEKSRDTVHTQLSEISKALPALMRSQKINKKLLKQNLIETEDKITKEELANELMKLTLRAQVSGINAEEVLYEKCNTEIEKYKE